MSILPTGNNTMDLRVMPLARDQEVYLRLTSGERIVRWVPGGSGLAYLDSAGGVSNI